MKRNFIPKGKKTVILTIAASAVLGLSAMAFAGWGEGHGGHGYGGEGAGGGHGWHAPASGNHMNMSEEDYKAVVEARDAFLEQTEATRRELVKNEALLQAEMAGETPDMAKMKEIQNEISSLRAKMDQFRLSHMMEMKKKNPGLAGLCPYGAGSGHGMGQGMGHGMGAGKGAVRHHNGETL